MRSFRSVRGERNPSRRSDGKDLSVFASYGTPALAEGQLPKYGASRRAPEEPATHRSSLPVGGAIRILKRSEKSNNATQYVILLHLLSALSRNSQGCELEMICWRTTAPG
jgi:hypothetical protein